MKMTFDLMYDEMYGSLGVELPVYMYIDREQTVGRKRVITLCCDDRIDLHEVVSFGRLFENWLMDMKSKVCPICNRVYHLDYCPKYDKKRDYIANKF